MPAKIVQISGTSDDVAIIGDAANRLRNGQIVIVPTETVYGAACLLKESAAVARLKKIRGKHEVPPTLHLARPSDALRYTGPVSEYAQRLIQKLWPGPIGLIFDVGDQVRSAITGELGLDERELYYAGSITLRCPDHSIATHLLQFIDRPVVAVGAPRPWDVWLEHADLILDAGPTQYSKPSTLLHVQEKGYRIVRPGVYDERIIEKLLKTNILFVCSGNTCRSPMAEALAKKIVADRLKVSPDQLADKGYLVASAGTLAVSGSRAAAPAVSAIAQMGGDLSKHRSRPLTLELIHQADAIFVMGENHRRAILALLPAAAGKVHALDPAADIEDPIGGDEALYLSLARRLNTLVADRLSALKLV